MPADPQPALRRLKVPDDVAALIRGLHPDLKRKIRAALDDVLADPSVGKALRAELAGLRSCRVARFRIVYRVATSVIEIVAILHGVEQAAQLGLGLGQRDSLHGALPCQVRIMTSPAQGGNTPFLAPMLRARCGATA